VSKGDLILISPISLSPAETGTIAVPLASNPIKKLSNASQLIFDMETVVQIPNTNTSIDPRRSINTNNNPASFVDRI
jgi:hypothetical protein